MWGGARAHWTGAAALAVIALLAVAGCSDGDDESSSSTTATSTPLEIAALLIAPNDVTYVSEIDVGATGHWTSYTVDDVDSFSLADYATRLEVVGWQLDDVADDATSMQGTNGDAWIDALMTDGEDSDPARAYVCVWNAEPSDDDCADVQADRDPAVDTVPDAVEDA